MTGRSSVASPVQRVLHVLEPIPIGIGRHIRGFPQRLRRCTHLLPPFAMCAALPRSDYYEGSAPRSRPRGTWPLAVARSTALESRVPWCCRRSTVPLAARTARQIGSWRQHAHGGHTQSLGSWQPGSGCIHVASDELYVLTEASSIDFTARSSSAHRSPWHLR